MHNGWRPTVALVSAATCAVTLLLLGVALHRPDVVAFGVPFLAALVAGLARWTPGAVSAQLYATDATLLEEQPSTLWLRVSVPAGTDVVTASVAPGRGLTGEGAGMLAAVPDDGADTVRLRVTVTAQRWGRIRSGSAQVSVLGALGMMRLDTAASGPGLRVLPLRARFHGGEVLPQAREPVGVHRSRRPGEGADLAGVRLFTPGDRLKRINWPVSLRTGQLHVTQTVSDRHAKVVLVLDTSVDVALEHTSSLDVAVHAAAAIAEHYLRSGDRVGLIDLARPLRPVGVRAGAAHLDRIVDALLDVEASVTQSQAAQRAAPVAPQLARLAPRALVMLISPVIGAARPERAVEIARAGHTVLVIDPLGARPEAAAPGEWTQAADRLQMLERARDIDRLADLGVPVVQWRGSGSLDAVLAQLSRSAGAPRARR